MKIFLLIPLSLVYCKNIDLDDIDFEPEPPIVTIEDGTLRGGWEESDKGKPYAVFEKIRYAEPPVDALRFKAPVPVKPWTGIYNASGLSSLVDNCLQYEPLIFKHFQGNEDCLFINVNTPRVDLRAKMPVMVFIHGGAFFYGAGNYNDPARLMDLDLVVVTLNYRLGPFGFLSTGDDVIPGNAGLKDQALALRWVKKNIRAFGGDPENINLVGFSSGAASVHYHYLSPLSKGTFTRGVAMSGSALVPWAYASNPAKYAKELASYLNCSTASSKDIAQCLVEKSPHDILVATFMNMTIPNWNEKWWSPFVPTAEPEGLEGAFITKHPYELTKAGDIYDAPLLVTTVSEEGLYPAAAFQSKPEKLPEIEKRWYEFAPELFHYKDTLPEDQKMDVANKIKNYYLQGKPVSDDTFKPLVQALGDRSFVLGVGKMAELIAAHNKQPVYLYRYSFVCDTTFSLIMSWNDKNYGVSHGDDFFHIFNLSILSPEEPKEDDKKMNDVMTNLMYGYFKNSTPTLPKEAPKWTPVTPGSSALNFLEIQSPSNFLMKKTTNFGERKFWDSLGFNEYDNYNEDAMMYYVRRLKQT